MAVVMTIRTLGRHAFKKSFRFSQQYQYPVIVLTKTNLDELKCNMISTQYKANFLKSRILSITLNNFATFSDDSTRKEQNNCTKQNQEPKLTLFQRFKKMYKDYWYVLVPVHIVTSAFWLGGFYCLAKSGVDIVSLLETLHFSERITNSFKDSSMGYIAITYALYKITTPVRYAVTLGGTTVSIQYLTKWGYIKPVPSKERLVEIYHETKEDLKERKENIMETVRETKADIREKKDKLKETMKETKKSIREVKESLKTPQEVIEDVRKKMGTVRDQKKSS